ncbi:MAG TPA: oxygenase MpaB family protein [Candidatus Dormibacteraeota bacterium]|jgi:uncharacterized protein (DUF2236 family)|nr:oxygenase MpaB family protein [Candidatus Dormibacteraeota bacterium]
MQYHPILTPESQAWRRGSDPRGLFLAGRALVLQVAHPTVAAGVREHSGFRADPWGRLERTLDSLYTVLYSPDAAAECARLRALHRTIRGVAPGGRRYSALEPEAYAWVHATIIETIAVAQAWAARPLRGEQLDRYYAEMREVGRMLGLRPGDLPETWDGFLAWYDGMVRTRLEDSDVVHQVLDSLSHPARPPVPHLPGPVWALARHPVGHLVRLGTVGLLPPPLRERIGVGWSRADDLELRTLGAALRATDPVVPARLRVLGPTYLRVQRLRRRAAAA